MHLKLIAPTTIERLLASPAGRTLKMLVDIIERRPGLQVHVIAGHPRVDDPGRPCAAIAFVVADADGQPWGLTVVEMTEPSDVNLASAIGVVEVVAAEALRVVNRALPSLKSDVLGKSYDFSIEDEEA